MSAPVMNGAPPIDDRDDVKSEVLTILDGASALTAVDKAAIDMQIATAKQYPRSVTKSLQEALTLATLDEETAASMFYSLPRKENGKNKMIEGPSARLAEIMVYTWTNMRADADIVAEDKTHITAMGTCFDLERNIAIRVRVKRRITTKSGGRFNDDMIGVTGNAAISIALRNAVFKVIPRALVDRIYESARKASTGKAGTIAQKQASAMQWFARLGVTPDEIFAVLEVKGWDDVGEEELITLRGIKSAIKDGEASVDNVFRPARGTTTSEATTDLNLALAAKKQEPAAAAAPTPEPTPSASVAPEPAPAPAKKKPGQQDLLG